MKLFAFMSHLYNDLPMLFLVNTHTADWFSLYQKPVLLLGM